MTDLPPSLLVVPDVQPTRELLQELWQHADQPLPPPYQPEPHDAFWTHRLSEEIVGTIDVNPGEVGDERQSQGSMWVGEFDLSTATQVLFRHLMRLSEVQKPDYLRAHVLMDGLDPVPKDLLSRYELVRCEDNREPSLCVVCNDPLALDPPYEAEKNKIVTFPCLHLFHSECILPWFVWKTTCPMCRHDVDPDSLTLNGGNPERPWVPPAKGILEAWVQAQEKNKSFCP